MGTLVKIAMVVGAGLLLGLFITAILNPRECISSHVETQYRQPMSMVVGQSKDFGGVAVPLGNMKPVEVEVCDEYATSN